MGPSWGAPWASLGSSRGLGEPSAGAPEASQGPYLIFWPLGSPRAPLGELLGPPWGPPAGSGSPPEELLGPLGALFWSSRGRLGGRQKITTKMLKNNLLSLIDFDPQNEASDAQFPTPVFARRSTFDLHGFRHNFDCVCDGFRNHGCHSVSVASVVEAKARLHENHRKT